MKKVLLFFAMGIALSANVLSQDITITFAAEGESTTVDTVVATNLTTMESVTIPGNETLVLHQVATGIEQVRVSDEISISPNPYNSTTNLYVHCDKKQNAIIKLSTISGGELIKKQYTLPSGVSQLTVSGDKPGLYILSVITNNKPQSVKIVQKSYGRTGIELTGSTEEKEVTNLKNSLLYSLNYSLEDIISYEIKSGDNISVVNATPTTSTTITGTIVSCVDVDNNHYRTVKIGDQIWMADNLKVTHYPDGTPIPHLTNQSDWNALDDNNEAAAYCVYNNNANNEIETYGALYTWPAALGGVGKYSNDVPSGIRGICPAGWHVPSDKEWMVLEKAIGMSDDDLYSSDYSTRGAGLGPKLKSAELWHDLDDGSSGNGTDDYGFYGIPGGYRMYNGYFSNITYAGYWWTTTYVSYDDKYSYYRKLSFRYDTIIRSNHNKTDGYSVRCVKD
jgi:uncharacterized protein (TIGR02145 family)